MSVPNTSIEATSEKMAPVDSIDKIQCPGSMGLSPLANLLPGRHNPTHNRQPHPLSLRWSTHTLPFKAVNASVL